MSSAVAMAAAVSSRLWISRDSAPAVPCTIKSFAIRRHTVRNWRYSNGEAAFNSWAILSRRDTSRGFQIASPGRRQIGRTCRAAALDALIFDCDGVILESEDLHRRAYNLTFEHFGVKCGPAAVNWDTELYDVLQNTVGGGKPKMRWYFGREGWPSSTLLDAPPESEADQAHLIDALQDWKTNKYQELISSGAEPRPGILELMDEARSQGLKVAVCSAATKSSVVFCLNNLLGKERFESLDCFLAGDDVKIKKPDPTIYKVAAEKLRAEPDRCLVIEDSFIGLQAAVGAGMNCIITYTFSTAKQDFSGAKATYADLAGVQLKELTTFLEGAPAVTT